MKALGRRSFYIHDQTQPINVVPYQFYLPPQDVIFACICEGPCVCWNLDDERFFYSHSLVDCFERAICKICPSIHIFE